MKTLKIGDKEYILEFSFEAAKHRQLINKMFKMMSCSYLGRSGLTGAADETKADRAAALIDGVADMYSEMPDTAITAFYAGLMENNAVLNEAEARKLLKQYFKENSDDESATFPGMFDLIKECMQDDGFFKLTGLDKMLENQAAAMAAEAAETAEVQPAVQSKSGKTRTSSKAKSTSAE